jgi:hypothetical protein
MALWANHAWNDYVAQVWTWGLVYSRDTFVTHPVAEGVRRTLNWAGFQSAAVAGTFCFLWHERDSPDRLRFAGWVLISLLALAAGWRFFPRYYFQLLPVVCLLGARALATAKPAMRWFFVALLLIPVLRFGPRYISLGLDSLQGKPHTWTDLAMNNDSKQAGELVRAAAKPGDTLLVWGYRADVFVYSGLHAGTRFLDSQPLTGVMADRHLVSAKPSAPEWAMANRQELIHTKPTFLVDGLGPFNPSLGLEHYPDLRQWLAQYQVIGRTPTSIVYRLVQSQ